MNLAPGELAIAKIGVMKDVRRLAYSSNAAANGAEPPAHAPTAGLPG